LSDTIIKYENVTFGYSENHTALKNISLTINKNEKIAVIGGNGAGKSTLLLLLCGILKGKGEIEISGLPLIKENLIALRKKMGLLFQDPDDQLFCPTVFEDIAFGPLNLELPDEEIKRRVKESLLQVGLPGFEDRSPHHLSYGEMKRISLATLFAMKPEILALDEPTSNLDPKTRRKILEILKNYSGTLIITTHDLEAVLELSNRAILLYKGEIVKDGKTVEIISDENLMNKCDLEIPLSIKLNKL